MPANQMHQSLLPFASEANLQRPASFKVAIAQIATDPGKIEANVAKCIEQIEAAKQAGAKLVVFPEATIPAYCCMDLQYNRAYIQDNLKALEQIGSASQGIAVVIGFIDTNPNGTSPGGRPQLYNSAAIFKDGELLGIQDKSLLPNYEIFFEDRYYSPARSHHLFDLGDIKLGVSICEDFWAKKEGYAQNPLDEFGRQRPDLLVNISASPFHLEKFGVRSELVTQVAQTYNRPCLYANLVGAFDGYEGEVVFDGRSLVTNDKGEIIGVGKAFSEDLLLVDVFADGPIDLPERDAMAELHDALVLGIKEYVRRTRGEKKKVFIGASGGIDSAVVAALAVEALGADNVVLITMPSKYNSEQTRGAAYDLAQNLGCTLKTVPIQQEVEAILAGLKADPEIRDLADDVAEENVQARLRMINLMYYGNKQNGLVLNTGNKTELALNNCTIYGDMVGGFSVLGDVDKDRIYELARHINQRAGREVIPSFTIETPPSAELAPNQLDAHVMGDHPALIAPMVRDIVENQLTLAQITAKYGERYSKDQIMNVLKRLDQSEWKRRQASPGIRVTAHAFGNGRKMPMSHGYYK